MQVCKDSFVSMLWMNQKSLGTLLGPLLLWSPLYLLTCHFPHGPLLISNMKQRSSPPTEVYICLSLAVFRVLCLGLGDLFPLTFWDWLPLQWVWCAVPPVNPQHSKLTTESDLVGEVVLLLMKRNRSLPRELHPILRHVSEQLGWVALSKAFSLQPQMEQSHLYYMLIRGKRAPCTGSA